jgi:hypothetical protein
MDVQRAIDRVIRKRAIKGKERNPYGHRRRFTVQGSWRNAKYIYALADSDRHLGHVIKTDKWHAYDATHSDEAVKGFKYLGRFVDLAAAKQAVESAVVVVRGTGTRSASG